MKREDLFEMFHRVHMSDVNAPEVHLEVNIYVIYANTPFFY